MRRWSLFLIVLLVPLLAFSGPWPARADTLQINAANNYQTLSLNLGQPLELSLQGNLTTGYAWSIAAAPDKSILAQTSNYFVPISSLIGAGGTEYWIFKAVGAGSTSISLVYSRPWTSVPPVSTFSVDVNVGSGATPGTGNRSQVKFVIGSSGYSVNGTIYKMDAAAFISNGRSFVPVRYLIQALGLPAGQISWDAADNAVLLPPDQNGNVFSVKIGDDHIYQIGPDGKSGIFLTMDATPLLIGGRAYLPAGYIAELYGYSVAWDVSQAAVLIT